MGWKFYNSNGVQRTAPTQVLPAGSIIKFGGTAAPTGWLLCDGSDVLASLYPDLAAVIGPAGPTCAYASNGTMAPVAAGYLRLPDFRGHSAIGSGTAQAGTGGARRSDNIADPATYTRGQKYGYKSHLLAGSESGIKKHGHSITDKAHGHTWQGVNSDSIVPPVYTFGKYPFRIYQDFEQNWPGGSGYIGQSYTGITATNEIGAQQADNGHNNVGPVLAVNFIIKY